MSDNPYGFIPPARRKRRAWPWLAVVLAVVAVLAAVALAGCSSSASTAATPSAASVALRLGCTGAHHQSPGAFVYDEVTATCHGRAVTVATFRTDALRDEWVKIAGVFTGIAARGHLWAVADSPG